MRVRILHDHNDTEAGFSARAGQVLAVTPDLAYKLVDAGVAEMSKDMAPQDYKVKNGNTRHLRSNHRR